MDLFGIKVKKEVKIGMIFRLKNCTSDLNFGKKASEVASETIRILQDFKDRIHTITSDNGLEFANHKEISKVLECDYYFCHPYSSCERGLNEYTNGLIRQYIPKGTSFENITKKEIKKIEDKLNNRPRKSLGWRTPNEVFFGLEMAA